MPSIINSDNGSVSGSAGLKSSADSSGVLALQTNGTTAVTVDASQNVGIGTSSPIRQFSVGTPNGGANATINMGSGTSSLGTLEFGDGTTGDDRFRGYVQYSHADNSLRLGTDAVERMRIESSGNVLVKSAAGLGYGTGSGGTVTQATNKSTGVTLNKPTGQITMNNAAMTAGGVVEFAFTNSLIAASDVVVLNANGFINYRVEIRNIGSGSCAIRVTNISAASLSDALIINFAVIKGATS